MKKQVTYLILSIIFLILTSCDKRFEEINNNPNALKEIDNEYLFANSILLTFKSDQNGIYNIMFGGQYAHMYVCRAAPVRYADVYDDGFLDTEYKYVFNHLYQEPIRHINEVLRLTSKGGEQENELRHAMAVVMAMVNYSRLTDAFGAVPYFEGGLGQENILYPKYDDVETIYPDMISRLKDATEIISAGEPANAYPGADPLFDNDLGKWARFANSLRLRLAMRIRFVEPILAGTHISECLSIPLIENNEENAAHYYSDSDIRELQNPVNRNYIMWSWKMSAMLIDSLKTTGDPRLMVFAEQNEEGEYIGIPNGLTNDALVSHNWNEISDPSQRLIGKDAPAYLLTASEVAFLKAEASLFNIGPADNTDSLYREGIKRSMEMWEIPDSSITKYLQESPTASLKGNEEERFGMICTQHWLACMPNTVEAWSNIRRTGYPLLNKRTEAIYDRGVTGGILPKRLQYPINEININSINYLDALERQGEDKISTALWWDIIDR